MSLHCFTDIGPGYVCPLVIFDLDGVLADVRHRLHYIDPLTKGKERDYERFNQACVNDTPIKSGIALMNTLLRSADVWIFTGRSEAVRENTVEWLLMHTQLTARMLETGLMMRRVGDRRRTRELKQEWYAGMLPVDRCRLIGVFEDHPDVVRMWRENHVPCFDVGMPSAR